MGTVYVLDTSVLLHEPAAIFSFHGDVVIPIAVIEEIDGQRKRQDEVGRNARRVSTQLDKLRERGKLYQGVELDNGTLLWVELNHQDTDLPYGLDKQKPDNRILSVAKALQSEYEQVGKDVILITKDINMRVKSDALGVQSCDFESDKVKLDDLYTGVVTKEVSAEQIDCFYQDNELACEEGCPNQFVILESSTTSQSALTRFSNKALRPLIHSNSDLWGIRGRNKEQRFALELLLDDDIKLVTLVGKAGTGKTLLALAAGVFKVMEEQIYRRLLVTRPVIPMGKDIGFLPGDKDEKLRPWMQPIYDNLELIFSNRGKGKVDRVVDSMKDQDLLELEALTYIRGRSIPKQFIVLDEAQNLSPLEVKTIITRVGEGTKIVVTGDPYQIDHPYLDSDSNGLTYLVERFKHNEVAGHVFLTKGERSGLAEIAAHLL